MKKIAQPQLAKNKQYFVVGGQPWFYFADTFWYGCSERCSRKEFKTIIDDRAAKGVNVIQIVIGFPPESSLTEIMNRGGTYSPLRKDKSINSKYFAEASWRLQYIVEKGMVPCVVGGWGWQIDQLGPAKMSELWTATLKSLGNLPALLCLCGEVDFFPVQISSSVLSQVKSKLATFFPNIFRNLITIRRILKLDKKNNSQLPERLQKWQQVVATIRQHDTHHRPLTVHVSGFIAGSELFNNNSLFDYEVIQSGHEKSRTEKMVAAISKLSRQGKLVLNMEPAYEGIFDDFYGEYQAELFELCVTAGAAGHAYGAHGIWQMGTDDGFLNHWGNAQWRQALNYSGLELVAAEVRQHIKTKWWKK